MRGLEREHRLRRAELRFQHALSLMSNAALSDESFQKVQKRAFAKLEQVEAVLEPWLKSRIEEAQQQQVQQLRSSYVEQFGDPNDPKYKQQIEETVAALLAPLKEDPATPEELVDRRMQERWQRRKPRKVK